jgi:hypothetical protein
VSAFNLGKLAVGASSEGAKDKRLKALEARVAQLEHDQSLVARRLTSFAQGVAKVIGATTVNPGTVVDDYTTSYILEHEDGPWVELVVRSTGNKFKVQPADATDVVNTGLELEFKPDGSLTRLTVVALRGYADIVKSNGPNDQDLEFELHGMLAKSATPKEPVSA